MRLKKTEILIVVGYSMSEAFRIVNGKLVIQNHSTQTLELTEAITFFPDQSFS
jgi:hypothetical protein